MKRKEAVQPRVERITQAFIKKLSTRESDRKLAATLRRSLLRDVKNVRQPAD